MINNTPPKSRLVFFLLAFCLSANAQLPKGMLSIGFNHFAGDQLIVLDTSVHHNEMGQSYTLGNLKYYISGIVLQNENGKTFESKDYFLINEDNVISKKISLSNIPEGKYTSIRFIVGVDSAHNCSGAQSGALDPANTMFWAWNTGYIFIKIEGKSVASSAPGKIIEYHIGGYKQPVNCIRSVSLPFEKVLEISKTKAAEINIKTDISEAFKTPNKIDFSQLPSVTDQKNAKIIADNYSDMFSIISIK